MEYFVQQFLNALAFGSEYALLALGFRPFYLLGFDPCVWGLTASLVVGIVYSLITPPPDPTRVARLFNA